MAEFVQFGIPMDDHQFSAKEVQSLLAEMNVPVSDKTVARIRAGIKSGERTLRRVETAVLLERGDVSVKDNLYLNLVSLGRELRTHAEIDSHRYSALGLTTAVSQMARFPEDRVRKAARAMRTDLVFSQLDQVGPTILPVFHDTVQTYFADYRKGANISPRITALSQQWTEGSTIDDFYRLCTQVLQVPKLFITWTPYELDVLQAFYQQRIEAGSKVSPFDRIILEEHINGPDEVELVNPIRSMSGVPFDRIVGDIHRNALVFGKL